MADGMQRDRIALQRGSEWGATPRLRSVTGPEPLHAAWATGVFSGVTLGRSQSGIRLCTWGNASLEYHTPHGVTPPCLPLLEGAFQCLARLSLLSTLARVCCFWWERLDQLWIDLRRVAQQSLPEEVGDASEPAAPSPALSCQPSHHCPYEGLLDRNTLCLSLTQEKQKLV